MINLKNEEQTLKMGKIIASSIEDGCIIALIGNLGSGKTTLSKSIIYYITDIKDTPSPTFNIVNEYNANEKTIYHFDFYRLEDEKELYGIGFDDYISNRKAIILIEWADKFLDFLPQNHIKIQFEKLENSRNICISSFAGKYIDTVNTIIKKAKEEL